MNTDTMRSLVADHIRSNERIVHQATGLTDEELSAPADLDHMSAFETLLHIAIDRGHSPGELDLL